MEIPDNIEIIEPKRTPLRHRNRYPVPDYVAKVRDKFKDKFPNDIPSMFAVEYAIRYFWEVMTEEILAGKVLHVVGYGKFKLIEKESFRTGKDQNYFKFEPSAKYILRLRGIKGTLTDSEKKDVLTRKITMAEIWRNRNLTQLQKNKYISPALQKGIYEAEQKLGGYKSELEKLMESINSKQLTDMQPPEE